MIDIKDIENKIINADCMDILKELPDKCVDLSFTSPPYNRKRNDKYKNYNDCIDDYYDFLCNFTNELVRITRKYVIINIQSNFYNKIDVYKFFGHYAEIISQVFIWEKLNPLPANANNITNAYEYFIFLSKDAVKANTSYIKNHITTPVSNETTSIHKAVMPLKVAEYFVKNFSEENDLILDNFSGLGTTAVACHNLKRRFICIEKDKDYFDASVERLKNAQAQMKLF